MGLYFKFYSTIFWRQNNLTDQVLCKVAHLYFEMNDHWLLTLKLLLYSAVGLDRSPSPSSIHSHTGTSAQSHFACFQVLIEYYMKGLSSSKCGRSSYTVPSQSSNDLLKRQFFLLVEKPNSKAG